MILTSANLLKVISVLKKRFPNLTVEETVELASAIIDVISYGAVDSH